MYIRKVASSCCLNCDGSNIRKKKLQVAPFHQVQVDQLTLKTFATFQFCVCCLCMCVCVCVNFKSEHSRAPKKN